VITHLESLEDPRSWEKECDKPDQAGPGGSGSKASRG
jgi:hypothetical protein